MSIPDFNKSFRDTVFPGSNEPLTTFNFMVLVGTRPLGDFKSVEGIKYKMPVEKLYEGGRNHSPHLLPFGDKGAGEWGTVTLKWGSPVWSLLYDWMNAVQAGHFFRRDVFILQLRRNGWPSRIMRLHKAFPIGWSAPTLDTSTSTPSMESLELAFEAFNMVLTRTDSMPTLDDLASMAAAATGSIAGMARDSALTIADTAVDIGETAAEMGVGLYEAGEFAWGAYNELLDGDFDALEARGKQLERGFHGIGDDLASDYGDDFQAAFHDDAKTADDDLEIDNEPRTFNATSDEPAVIGEATRKPGGGGSGKDDFPW